MKYDYKAVEAKWQKVWGMVKVVFRHQKPFIFLPLGNQFRG